MGFERAEIALTLSLFNLISNAFLTRYERKNLNEHKETEENPSG